MKRNIISVLIGLVAAIAVFLIAETLNGLLHPTPKTLDYNDSTAVKIFYKNQPITFWLLILTGWVIGSMLCGLLIKIISKKNNKKLPLIAGCILTVSAVANFLTLPHPTWFIIVGFIIFVPSTLIGHNLYKLKPNG